MLTVVLCDYNDTGGASRVHMVIWSENIPLHKICERPLLKCFQLQTQSKNYEEFRVRTVIKS